MTAWGGDIARPFGYGGGLGMHNGRRVVARITGCRLPRALFEVPGGLGVHFATPRVPFPIQCGQGLALSLSLQPRA